MAIHYDLIKAGDKVQQVGFLPAMSCLGKDKVYTVIETDGHQTLPDLLLEGIKDMMSCTNFKRLYPVTSFLEE